MAILTFQLNERLFVRDPQTTALGQKIILQSVEMIGSLGFELFTFKKLGEEIGSTEASIYRYFENKQRLLLYLIDWYWTWVDHQLDYEMNNVKGAPERLRKCLQLLTRDTDATAQIAFVKEKALQRIVMTEFEKTYLTKHVDLDNKEGLFLPYKIVCKKLAAIILEINPGYHYPHSLVSTALLALTHQLYYSQHLPSLSDIKYGKQHSQKLYEFLERMIFKTIQK